jgi:hypothetical protein
MTIEDEGCRGIIGALLGHKFEARYSEKDVQSPIGNIKIQRVTGSLNDIQKLLNAHDITKTYEYDVCVRCGKIVKKPQE